MQPIRFLFEKPGDGKFHLIKLEFADCSNRRPVRAIEKYLIPVQFRGFSARRPHALLVLFLCASLAKATAKKPYQDVGIQGAAWQALHPRRQVTIQGMLKALGL